MNKTLRNICVSLLAIIGASAFCGTVALVSADGGDNSAPAAPATVLTTDENFKMIDGASVRLEEDMNGLKFVAELGTDKNDDVNYYMLIVPNSYLEHFGVTIANTTNYYEELRSALSAYDEAHSTNTVDSLAVMACAPFTVTDAEGTLNAGNYYVQGSLTNIRFDNSNVDFFGVAFYVDGEGNYTYAQTSASNLRSITEVAAKAYESETTFTDGETTILKKYISNGINKHLGKAQGTEVDFAALAEGALAEFDINDTKTVAVDLPDSIPVTYESSADSVATVSDSGVITAVAEGTATVSVTVLDTVAEYEVKVYDIANDETLKSVDAQLATYNADFKGVSPANIHTQAATVVELDADVTALGEFRASKLVNYASYSQNKNTFVLFEDYSNTSGKFTHQGGGYSGIGTISNAVYGTLGSVGCGQTANVFKYNDCATIDYGTCEYVQFLVINDRHSSNLVVKIIQEDDWDNTFAQTKSIAYGESALLTVSVADFKRGIIRADFDAASTNGTNFLMGAMYAVSPSQTTQSVITAINAIGEVTLEKQSAITAARTAYNALTMQQELVTNYSTLQAAEASFKTLAREEYLTENVTALESKISAFNALALSPSTVKQLTADKAVIDAAYAALTDNEKSIVIDYDKYLEKKSSFVIFEDYSNSSGVFTGSAGWGGVIADNRTNVAEYGICASCGLSSGTVLFTIKYNRKSSVPSDYSYVSFAVKNTRAANLKFRMWADSGWSQVGEILIESGKTDEWNVVTIPMADFVNSNNMLRVDFDAAYTSGETNVWFSPMYAHN